MMRVGRWSWGGQAKGCSLGPEEGEGGEEKRRRGGRGERKEGEGGREVGKERRS